MKKERNKKTTKKKDKRTQKKLFMTDRKGYEWLEADTELYNLLIEKQREGDQILNLFNIQFMDDSYTNEDMEEMNRIYILRDRMTSDGKPTTMDGDGYHTLIEVIIRTSNYDPIQGQRLLKTAVKCIDQHIKLSSLSKYCKINQLIPKYEKPGHLRQYTLELLAYEIHEKTLYPSICSKDLRIDLCVQIGIENTDKEWHKVFPHINHNNKPIPIHKTKEGTQKYEEIPFGGG